MPKYQLQAPDGRVVIFEADSPEKAEEGAREWYASTEAAKGAKPDAALAPTKGGDPLSAQDPRSQTYSALVKAGRIDPKAPEGSVKNPRVQFDGDKPANGEFYIDKSGRITQSNGVAEDAVMSYGSGLWQGLEGLFDSGGPGAIIGQEDDSLSPMDVLQSASNFGMGLGQTIGGDPENGARGLAAARETTATGRASALGMDYVPQSQLGRFAQTAGQMTPNALVPAGVVGRVANVLAPTVGTEIGGALAKAGGANEQQEQYARLAGGALGGVAAGIRPSPRPPTPRRAPLDVMQRTAAQDPVAMRRLADEYRAAGIDPALIDVVDESGRGVTRATASRMTPAREEATNFRDARALDLPDRINRQAQRLSTDPRTPDQIRADLTARRTEQGNEQFAAVRNEEVSLAPDTVLALRSPQGRAAINAAGQNALNSLDPEVRAIGARLNALASDALDNPGQTTVTVGMSQEISKGLLDAAEAAQRSGNNNQARLLGDLGRAVRDNARATVPGYDEALNSWAAESRLIEATDVGENLMRANTDEFVSAVEQMGPDEQAMARAAGRRAVERSVGENPASAPGVARRIATAPEQQARTRALAGDDAEAFQTGVGLEERALRNANDIAPRSGSQTQLRSQDAADVGNAISTGVQVGAQVLRGDVPGLITRAANWWASRGFSRQQAEEFTRLAIDPRQTDDAIRYIEQQYGVQAARQFLEFRAEAGLIGGATGASSGSRTNEPTRRLERAQ
ncbi:MAG: hypothetical protein Q7T61_00875 [Caulobacter sp.]|nr:hypothetical protein [Caulobacter sp.]